MPESIPLPLLVSGLSLLMVIFGVIVSFYVANRGKCNDDLNMRSALATDTAKLFSGLDSIMISMAEIKVMLKDVDRKLDDHTERIVIIETDMKTLFKNYDKLLQRFEELSDKHNDNMAMCPMKKEG